jgi:hypothetical protein
VGGKKRSQHVARKGAAAEKLERNAERRVAACPQMEIWDK